MAPFLFLSKFEAYLAYEKRYSQHTIIAYIKDLSQFIEYSCVSSIEDFREITHSNIRSWIVSLVEESNENRTVNRKLSSLRTFFRWMRREQIIVSNPIAKINGPRNVKRLPTFAKESELESNKINSVFNSNFEGLRDKLIFELFYQTGIRLTELINIKESDVNVESIKILGKRNKERLIPISPELFQLIAQYRILKRNIVAKNNFLIVLDSGEKMYSKFVYRKIIYYLSMITNLDKKSPHVLRHTFATHLLNNGAGLETIKDLLGHSNLAATQVYTHNSFAKLSNIYSQAHPRGRNIN